MFVLRWTTISIHISTSGSMCWHATHSNEPNDGRHFECATPSHPVVGALYGIRFRCRAREITATAVSKSFWLTTHCTRNWQRSIISHIVHDLCRPRHIYIRSSVGSAHLLLLIINHNRSQCITLKIVNHSELKINRVYWMNIRLNIVFIIQKTIRYFRLSPTYVCSLYMTLVHPFKGPQRRLLDDTLKTN